MAVMIRVHGRRKMLNSRQYSLAYLMISITVVALAAGLIRIAFLWGDRSIWFVKVVLATVVGVSLMALATWLTFHAIRVVSRWPRAAATVVRYTIRRNEGQPFYYPVVKFTAHDGKPIVAIWNSGYWRRYWPTGPVVSVRYAPRNPRWVEILVPSNLWGFALPVSITGFLLFIVLTSYVVPKYAGRPTIFSYP